MSQSRAFRQAAILLYIADRVFIYHLVRGAVESRREGTGLDCADQPILKEGRIKVIRSCTTDRLCIRALSDEKTCG
jgi:hypothetical protein